MDILSKMWVFIAYAKLTATILGCSGRLPGHCYVVARGLLDAYLLIHVKSTIIQGCFQPFDSLIGETHRHDCFKGH